MSATDSDASPTGNQDPATGRSIMWALVAIVFHAMQQPSFSGHLSTGDAFKNTIWPQRSSPAICLVDMIAEIRMMLDKRRDPSNTIYARPSPAKPTVIITRLAIFLVAVLPQAIKLFSMKGIPTTQVLASVFFASSLICMMRTLLIEDPSMDTATFVLRLKEWKQDKIVDRIIGCAWAFHGVCIVLTWHSFYKAAKLDVAKDLHNLIDWCSVFCVFAFLACLLLRFCFKLVDLESRLPAYIFPILLAALIQFGMADILKDPEHRSLQAFRAAYLAFDVRLCSYGITHLLDLFTKTLLRWAGLEAGLVTEGILGTTNAVNPAYDMSGALNATVVSDPQLQTPSNCQLRSSSNSNAAWTPVQRSNACASAHVLSMAQETSQMEYSPNRASRNDIHSMRDNQTQTESAQPPLSRPTAVLSQTRSRPDLSLLEPQGILLDSSDQSTHLVVTKTTSNLVKVGRIANWVLLKVVIGLLEIVGTALQELFSSLYWLERQLKQQPKDKSAVAWGLNNIITAATFYLAVFNDEGTSVPSWTSILG